MKLDRSTRTLLRGLLLPGAEARSYLTEWCRGTDLQAVDSATHQLLPLLYRRLADLGLSPPEMDRLRGVHRKTWYRNQRHLAALQMANEVLSAAHIDVTFVGGLTLALGAYDDLGLRMLDAAQIVVPLETTDRCIDKLIDSGFVVDGNRRTAGFGLPTRLRHQDGGHIDVREFVYGPGWPDALDQRLSGRTSTVEVDGRPIRTLPSSDAMAAAAAFGLTVPLGAYRCLVDLVFLSKRSDRAVSWADLVADYQDTLLSVPLAEALRTIGEEIPGALNSEAGNWVPEIRPTWRQRMQFWFHRRGRRLARMPAWYWRGTRRPGSAKDTGFIVFAKSVYDVTSTREAWAKLRRRLRRG